MDLTRAKCLLIVALSATMALKSALVGDWWFALLWLVCLCLYTRDLHRLPSW